MIQYHGLNKLPNIEFLLRIEVKFPKGSEITLINVFYIFKYNYNFTYLSYLKSATEVVPRNE